MAETKVDSFMVSVPSEAQGDILYRNGSRWTRLPAGTAEWVLTTKGAGQNPVWQAPASANITSWATWSPTFDGFGTVSNVFAVWRMAGDDTLEMRVTFTPGTPTSVEARMSLPSGMTVSNTKNPTGLQYCGQSATNSTASGNNVVALCERGNSYLNFGYQGAGTTGLFKQNGSDITVSGRTTSFTATVAI